MTPRIHVRTARTSDLPRLGELQRQFVLGHCGQAWTSRHLAEYLDRVSPLDPERVDDQTLFVAGLGARLVGFGSWSYRQEGSSGRPLEPAREPARLEVFFVEPEWLKGAGDRLLRVTEYAAKARGFTHASIRTCPDGAARFLDAGYDAHSEGSIRLPGGDDVPVVNMLRRLDEVRVPVRRAA